VCDGVLHRELHPGFVMIVNVVSRCQHVQGDAQNSTVSNAMLDTLLDRSYLAAKQPANFAAAGPGYELIAQQSAGLLSSVA
jgi:hypothetical protein